ncbi:MAG: hypothetical protein NTZ50_15355 [Chloroflexi bacterium]|nr:hypothetical protein [Chloroflexota bacterium]
MKGIRHSPAQIVEKLRIAEIEQANGDAGRRPDHAGGIRREEAGDFGEVVSYASTLGRRHDPEETVTIAAHWQIQAYLSIKHQQG